MLMIEDGLFYSSILVCVAFGGYYKKIEDVETKRNFGAGLGILISCLICGQHIIYSILMVWGNIIIIKCCDKRYVHQISLTFTWIYLVYIHFNVDSKYDVWLFQTLALRLVGLAFEVNMAEKPKLELKPGVSTARLSNDDDDTMKQLTPVEIIAYAFFFIGIHKGPYYRWKTFNDHVHNTFGSLSDYRMITLQKLKKALLCTLGYYLIRMKYSLDMYQDRDFYLNYGTDYRFICNVPFLLMYFLEKQILMMLCTSVCTETGFGVYPASTQPTPGYGPTQQFSLLKLVADTPDVALQQEYNFSMLSCFDNQKILMGPKMTDTMRGWDMATRHWFWAYTFKNCIKSNKEVRSACSFLAWTIWSGPSEQRIIMAVTLWVYVHLESEYAALYNTTGAMKGAWDLGFSMMRLFCLIYLTPCLVIYDTATALIYYNSIYWVYHLVLLFLTMGAIILYKSSHGALPLPLPPNAILIRAHRQSIANVRGRTLNIAENSKSATNVLQSKSSTTLNAKSSTSNSPKENSKDDPGDGAGSNARDKPGGSDYADEATTSSNANGKHK